MQPLLELYEQVDCYDEFAAENGVPRPHYAGLAATLRSIEWSDLRAREQTSGAIRALIDLDFKILVSHPVEHSHKFSGFQNRSRRHQVSERGDDLLAHPTGRRES